MKVIVIDVETGGLDPARHGVTQIGAIDGVLHTDGNGKVTFATVHTFYEQLAMIDGKEYGKEALAYQGLTIKDLTHGSNLCGALTSLSLFVEPTYRLGPGRIWAHEDTFDHRFIFNAYLKERVIGNNDPRIREWIPQRSDWNCSKRLARICRSVGLISHDSDSLDSICAYLGIGRSDFSDKKSLQDCMMTGHLIAALLTRLGFGQNKYFLDR